MGYYNDVINNVSTEQIERILNQLNISYVDKGSYLLMKTVCHHADEEEGSDKLYYYKDSHFFMCYSNCQGMSVIKFLENYFEVRGITTSFPQLMNIVTGGHAVMIEDGFSSPYQKEEKRDRHKEVELKPYSESILNVFSKRYPYEWLQEGISKLTMDKYNIRYSISQNKIIIPHYDINGRLVGIRGRALNEEDIATGKYKPVLIQDTLYSHPLSLNLYGLNYTKKDIKDTKTAILFESEKSVLLMDSYFGTNNSVAVCGSNFNKNQLLLLLKNCQVKNIVIAFDKEYKEIGTEQTTQYLNKLRAIGDKYRNYCNFYYLADKEGLLGYKDSPIDRGPDIFKYLMSKKMLIGNY